MKKEVIRKYVFFGGIFIYLFLTIAYFKASKLLKCMYAHRFLNKKFSVWVGIPTGNSIIEKHVVSTHRVELGRGARWKNPSIYILYIYVWRVWCDGEWVSLTQCEGGCFDGEQDLVTYVVQSFRRVPATILVSVASVGLERDQRRRHQRSNCWAECLLNVLNMGFWWSKIGGWNPWHTLTGLSLVANEVWRL